MSACDNYAVDQALALKLKSVLQKYGLSSYCNAIIKHGKMRHLHDLVTIPSRSLKKAVPGEQQQRDFQSLQLETLRHIEKEDQRLAKQCPPVVTVCVLGLTGHGKSSLLNMLCAQRAFTSSGSGSSVTQHARSRIVQHERHTIRVIDTPGLGEGSAEDTKHVHNIASFLKKVGRVDLFLITMKSTDARFSTQMKACIDLLKSMIGPGFFNHAAVVQTAWKMDADSVRDRKAQGITEGSRREEIQRVFQNHFGRRMIPVVFVDSVANPKAHKTQQNEAIAAGKTIINLGRNNPLGPYSCASAKTVRTELEEAKRQKEREEQRAQAEERRRQEQRRQQQREQEELRRQRAREQEARERRQREERERQAQERQRLERERENQRRYEAQRQEEERRERQRAAQELRALLQAMQRQQYGGWGHPHVFYHGYGGGW